MKPDVRLCRHHAADDLAALTIESTRILAWHDGPITAIAACPRCGSPGLLEMMDWNLSRRVRIYAFSGLEAGPLALYERNTSKGSCDVGRFGLETHALLSLAGPVERLVALNLDEGVVVVSRPSPEGLSVADVPWDQRLPPDDDAQWFLELGLSKHDLVPSVAAGLTC